MAETKRVSDQYTISSPTVIIDGNLTISGASTSVETTNSFISDNIIELNKGETGAGVGNGTGRAGIEIDRGSLPAVKLRWNEADLQWQITADGTNFQPIISGSVVTGAAGIDTSVQFNSNNDFAGDSNFTYNGSNLNIGDASIFIDGTMSMNDLTYDGFNLNIGDITITGTGSIFNTSSNNDLELFASGTGTIHVRSVLKLENEFTDPVGVSNSNQLYAKTPGIGASGVYFSNTENADELISKSKAVLFSMIF